MLAQSLFYLLWSEILCGTQDLDVARDQVLAVLRGTLLHLLQTGLQKYRLFTQTDEKYWETGLGDQSRTLSALRGLKVVSAGIQVGRVTPTDR